MGVIRSAIPYDELGREVVSSKGAIATSRDFDSLGDPISVTRAGRTVGYEYDADRPGRVTGVVYPNGQVVSRSYDAAGRWVGVTDWDGNTTSFGYDAESNVSSVTGPNSMSVTRIFDVNGAVSSVTYDIPGLTWPVSYGRGLGGELVSVTQWGSSGSWGYDADAQVVSSSNPSGTFAYDPGRNPTRLTGRFQAFDVSGELCWVGSSTGDCGQPPAGATVYDYDDDGQRTAAGAESFAYDAYGAMTSASSGSSGYSYSADGLRVSKVVNGDTTEFAWDNSVEVAELVQDGDDYYIYGPDGMPVERIGADPTVWLLTNETGSVASSIDVNGQLVTTRSYDSWGNEVAHTGDPVSLGWQSQYQDTETGLYYLRHRYYDPTTAQFLSPDPLFALSGDRYGYAYNDPINGSDPTGLWCAWWNDDCDFSDVRNFAAGWVSGMTGGIVGYGEADGVDTDSAAFGVAWWGGAFSTFLAGVLLRAGEGGVGRSAACETSVRSTLDDLGMGRSGAGNVRVVDSVGDLQRTWSDISRGGHSYIGRIGAEQVHLPDGTIVSYRYNSKSGGPAIDVRFPDGTKAKIHVRQ